MCSCVRIVRMKTKTQPSPESGNVLFYILIAVALLAALSYTVASSSRGSVSMLSDDKAALYATEIIEYGGVMANAVSQLRLRGYKDTQISFENSVVAGYTNANCTGDGCKVFHPSGAGVTYMAPKSEWLDSTWSADSAYATWGFYTNNYIPEIGTSEGDLILAVGFIDKTLCIALNNKLGVTNPSGDPPNEPGQISSEKFTGTYTALGGLEALQGKQAGCFKNTAGALNLSYFYVQTLMAR